jgi:uncharacterized protein YwgA
MGKGEVRWLVKFLGTSPAELTKLSAFETRLKLQKAVFLLSHLKAAPFTGYGFGMYVSGPYSPSLASEYYHLDGVRATPVKLDSGVKRVLRWFSSRDRKWLEVASSVLSIKERNKNVGKEDIYSVLTMSKPWVTRRYFDSVVADLERKQL